MNSLRQWPDGGAHPPGFSRGQYTVSPEMRTRLAELEASWDRRLANQKQVIQNLDADRARLQEQRDALFTTLREMQRILNHDYDASDQLELWHQLKDMVNRAVEGS